MVDELVDEDETGLRAASCFTTITSSVRFVSDVVVGAVEFSGDMFNESDAGSSVTGGVSKRAGVSPGCACNWGPEAAAGKTRAVFDRRGSRLPLLLRGSRRMPWTAMVGGLDTAGALGRPGPLTMLTTAG